MSSVDKIVIRPIEKRDFAQFFEVVNRAFDREIEMMGLDLQRFAHVVRFYDFVELASRVLERFRVFMPTILVAVSRKHGVVGGVHIVPHAKEVWTIDSLAVDPSYRKHGIGVHLISAALRYVSDRHGRKALTYVRADNVPSTRIRRRLHGEFFDKRVFMACETNRSFGSNTNDGSMIREARRIDALNIYRLCRAVDTKKATMFEVSPKSFQDSKSELLMSRIGLAHRKKWTLVNAGEIIAYADVFYASPKEAAKIEYLCLADTCDLATSAEQLLNAVFKTLRSKGIKKVAVTLSDDWKELIGILESLGFVRVASFYGVAHLLV